MFGEWGVVLFGGVDMDLTSEQKTALRTNVLADPAFNGLPQNADGAYAVAAAYNVTAAGPNNICWKTAVSNEDIGNAMNGTEIAGLSSLGMQRLQVLAAYSNGTQNPSRFDRRDAFDRVFSGSGGNVTRPALLALWKRTMLRIEKLFATGTGSDASPATLAANVDGQISYQDVQSAMGW